MSEVPENLTSEDLPPEPGTIGDPDHGIPDSEVNFDDDGEQFEPEINDDEPEEDDVDGG
jgi:hypothetical protein